MTDPFRRLDAPPGGWHGLQDKILADARRRRARRRTALAMALVTLLAWWLWPEPEPPSGLWSETHPALTLLATPEEPVRVQRGARATTALMRVETGSPDVLFYRIETIGE